MNRVFDQLIINVRERPVSTDFNIADSVSARTLRAMQRLHQAYRASTSVSHVGLDVAYGFVNDSFQVYASGGMVVQLRPGLGFAYAGADVPTAIGGISGLDDREPLKPMPLSVAPSITVPAADPTNPRIDIVEVKYTRVVTDPSSRLILDASSAVFVPTMVDKTLQFTLDDVVPTINGAAEINYKTGTPAGSPVAPTVTAGYVKLAEVYVDAAAVSLGEGDIADKRIQLADSGVHTVAVSVRHNPVTGAIIGTPTIVAPPGFIVGVATLVANAIVRCVVMAAGCMDTALGAVQVSANAVPSVGPTSPMTTMVELAASVSTGANLTGTAFYPNPQPLPINGTIMDVRAAILQWDTGTQLWVVPTATDVRVDFTFTIPVT